MLIPSLTTLYASLYADKWLLSNFQNIQELAILPDEIGKGLHIISLLGPSFLAHLRSFIGPYASLVLLAAHTTIRNITLFPLPRFSVTEMHLIGTMIGCDSARNVEYLDITIPKMFSETLLHIIGGIFVSLKSLRITILDAGSDGENTPLSHQSLIQTLPQYMPPNLITLKLEMPFTYRAEDQDDLLEPLMERCIELNRVEVVYESQKSWIWGIWLVWEPSLVF
ncbi:hypothetical protein JAAARDRAFT_197552 [Jaapia argillacea MUCL 33604]|uniref:Uncharacterized protein n=1 Tax=Jaapia argillacea MUCL 33604 TaxID=933084 RepID=A0A067PES4_9AGAM|nr:hypothetical protein JAAARDRAFT_197552 [Jaapia argillacea MUCL 33604]